MGSDETTGALGPSRAGMGSSETAGVVDPSPAEIRSGQSAGALDPSVAGMDSSLHAGAADPSSAWKASREPAGGEPAQPVPSGQQAASDVGWFSTVPGGGQYTGALSERLSAERPGDTQPHATIEGEPSVLRQLRLVLTQPSLRWMDLPSPRNRAAGSVPAMPPAARPLRNPWLGRGRPQGSLVVPMRRSAPPWLSATRVHRQLLGQPGSGAHMATNRPELKSPPGWAGLANPVDHRAAGQSTPELDLRRLPRSSAAQS